MLIENMIYQNIDIIRERPVDFQGGGGGAWYFQWSLNIFFSIFESLIIFFRE